MRYETYSYLYPPRPDQAVSPMMLPQLERQGFIIQIKKNGTCNVIAVKPSTGEIKAMNRHAEPHKAWSPDPAKMNAFLDLPGEGWYVFVAELLHSKVAGLRHINYVHDILVADGEYLVGQTQAARQAILHELFATPRREKTYSHYIVDDYTWVVREYRSGFKKLYDGLTNPEDEGVVLKKPSARLALCAREKSNNLGMLKARKAHKNYSF